MQILSGEPPDGDITKIFVPSPGSEGRVVQVRVSGQESTDVNLLVHGAQQAKDAGKVYQVDIWFCDPANPAAPATGYSLISIDRTGRYESTDACDVTPELSIAVDFDNATVASAIGQCESSRIEVGHFCFEDPQIHQAQDNFEAACSGP